MHTAAAGGTASTWGLGVCVGGATWERAHGFDGWKHGEVGRVPGDGHRNEIHNATT
jgi:hypothetical protein